MPALRRTIVGVALGVAGIAAAMWPASWAALVLVVSLCCLWELTRLVERKGAGVETPVALAAVVLYLALTYVGVIHRFEGDLLAATVVFALVFAAFGNKDNYLARSGFTLLCVFYIGKLASYFIAIRAIPSIGFLLTLFVMLTVVATDTFAMVVGKTIGKTPLSALSPRKTVEGALGGLAAGCIVGLAFARIPALHFTWWEAAAIALLTSVAAQAGDLVESALKRDADVKDAGTVLWGHGGVLDRFDSFLFGGIAFYFALWLIGFALPDLHAVLHGSRLW